MLAICTRIKRITASFAIGHFLAVRPFSVFPKPDLVRAHIKSERAHINRLYPFFSKQGKTLGTFLAENTQNNFTLLYKFPVEHLKSTF
ncbi:hypothetical protein D3Z36_08750 [Lachnospiraceae bacterium]|nr:hypothetical protein [Lachnospiraceae bacterium]